MSTTTDYRRQRDLFDPANHTHRSVAIIGLGNIGSTSAIALARMGIANFHLFDYDTVEQHNLASQQFGQHHLGVAKVDAVAEQIHAINPHAVVHTTEAAYSDQSLAECDIVISAVDTITSRRTIAAALIAQASSAVVIDGRMGGGQVEVYVTTPAKWPDTLPEQADTDPCSGRYISYTSFIIAGAIANAVKRTLEREPTPSRLLLHADTYDIITEYERT